MGSAHSDDLLVYDESSNKDYSVSVENSLSKRYLQINIESTFHPVCNEVWIRGVGDFDSKFWLVQPMLGGVRYYLKHSGSFLYKLSNEEDRLRFKLSKIPLPAQLINLKIPESSSMPKSTDQGYLNLSLKRLDRQDDIVPLSSYL